MRSSTRKAYVWFGLTLSWVALAVLLAGVEWLRGTTVVAAGAAYISGVVTLLWFFWEGD